MAKNEIGEYDETDAGNTDISGIGLSDATLIDQLDDIARAQMGALKRWFKSSLFRLRDSTDQTKLLAFDLSGITTGTTKTLKVVSGGTNLSTDAITLTQAEKSQASLNIGQAWELVPSGIVAVGSNVASVSWSGLSDYVDLRLRGYFVPTSTGNLLLRMGAGAVDVGANYGRETIAGSGSTLSAGFTGDTSFALIGAASTSAPTRYGKFTADIMAFNKNTQAHMLATGGASSGVDWQTTIISGYHNSLVGRDIISVLPAAGLIGAGSRFVLEGIRG